MRWYEGDIAEAVAFSKANGAIFIVYIEGKDDKSKEITALIDNKDISSILEQQYFVAIKIEGNSIAHQQFSQIYKQLSVPSIFFIGKSGVPLEIVTEVQSTTDFVITLKNILKKHGISDESLTQNVEKSEPSSSIDGGECSDKPPTSDVVSEDNKPEDIKSEDIKSEDIKSEEPSAEEKIERAQELINKKRQEKQAEEDLKARQKEIERRKTGQDVQKLKRWQQDQEVKDLMEERNKEKKEELEARQRVLAQIAQDKAERMSKFSNVAPSQASPIATQQPLVRNNNTARLQFKFPDGSTHTHEFSSDDTLQTVRNYLEKNLELPYQNFTLSTTFPRREFTEGSNSETLIDLQLVPNAVVLILPLQHGVVSANREWQIIAIFWTFITPILNILRYFKLKIFGPPPPTTSLPTNVSPTSGSYENTTKDSSVIPKKKSDSTVIRRQGNIHRLKDNTDSDEDNNTWNGNSTQQM
ncbi:hypothetical protein FQA39_LY08873 [Lamprigera yunnana]|nr:hypothetical protein FQA39_LY08873 [Lamprigera yunnana]